MKKSKELAEEYYDLMDNNYGSIQDLAKLLRDFAAHHVKKALQEALEEVPYGGSDAIYYDDVKGILTCYPKTNIE